MYISIIFGSFLRDQVPKSANLLLNIHRFLFVWVSLCVLVLNIYL